MECKRNKGRHSLLTVSIAPHEETRCLVKTENMDIIVWRQCTRVPFTYKGEEQVIPKAGHDEVPVKSNYFIIFFS